MEFDWSPEDEAFRGALRAFLAERLPESWEEISKGGPGSEAQLDFSRAFCADLAARGWLTPHWPAAWGGSEASAWRHWVLSEELWAAGEPRGSQYMNVNWIGPAIMQFGTEEQKRLHLPAIAAGRALWCQGFSEPNAGSDLAALRTRADREGPGGDDDVYVVNGQKIWTSYCNRADSCFLLVRTLAGSRRHRGISVLLVPMDLPGIEVREIPSIVGERYFHEVFFRDVRVPVACRLGPEHEGWDVVAHALAYERVGAARYARAARTLDALVARAADDGAFDGDDAERALARLEPLAEAIAECEAARLLAWRVIDGRAKGEPPSVATNLARVAGTNADKRAGELAVEFEALRARAPGDALAYGSFADANFRLSMTAGVAVGATEVQLDQIARRHLGLPREPAPRPAKDGG
ncbi:MAG: acyl-CoA dehydrogenase family protein [Myxococcota bacterium]|nr:acyl-CoA dehydrogenase family protein [Myxococcales bacterium]